MSNELIPVEAGNFEQYLEVLAEDDDFTADEMAKIIADLRENRELILMDNTDAFRGQKTVGDYPQFGIYSRAFPGYPIEADDDAGGLAKSFEEMGVRIIYALHDVSLSWARRRIN